MERILEMERLLREGHNIAITGQAGTGKTTLVRDLYDIRKSQEFTVQVVCPTGLACQQFSHHGIPAKTLHHYFGLLDGRYSIEHLKGLYGTEEYEATRKDIQKLDALFIDEVSMVSKYMFEKIHYVCCFVRESPLSFGGIQVVVCGDFFQLNPVPNFQYGDNGEMCFMSPLFKESFTHQFNLQEVKRYSADINLIKAVSETARGIPSKETNLLLCSLNRPLSLDESKVTRLFSTNFEVDIFNSNQLINWEGESKVYSSINEGNTKQLAKCKVPKELYLKVGVPVILLKNLGHDLVNGSIGTVIKLNEVDVSVHFPDLNYIVPIKMATFDKFSSSEEKVVAIRRQIPLKLAFAITLHSCQGLTLDGVVLDCSRIFAPGQVSVGISRVRSLESLQVLKYSPRCCISPCREVLDYYEKLFNIPSQQDLSCCKVKTHQSPIELSQVICDDINEGIEFDDVFTQEELLHIDSMIEKLDLETSHTIPQVENVPIADNIIKLNQELPIINIIQELIDSYKTPQTEQQKIAHNLLEKILQSNQLTKFSEYIIQSSEDIYKTAIPDTKLETKHLTNFKSQFFLSVLQSAEYTTKIKALLPTTNIDPLCRTLLWDLVCGIISFLFKKKVEGIDTTINLKTYPQNMSEEGRGRIRYVAGMCVAKERARYMKRVTSNLWSASSQKIANEFKKKHDIVKLLEIPYLELVASTNNSSESIEEVQRRNRGGLTHITDAAFNIFSMADKVCFCEQSIDNVNLYGENVLDMIQQKCLNDKNTINAWHDTIGKDNVDMEVFKDLVGRYVRVANHKFRKVIAKELGKKKEESHRRNIKVAKKKSADITKINFDSILKDSSANKIESHSKLKACITLNPDFLKSFTKDQISKIAKAYSLHVQASKKKDEFIKAVNKATLSNNNFIKPEIFKSTDTATERDLDKQKRSKRLTRSRVHTETTTTDTTETVPTPSTAPVLQQNEYESCPLCAVDDFDEDNGLQCDLCDTWYHVSCIGLSVVEYERLDTYKELEWICLSCTETIW